MSEAQTVSDQQGMASQLTAFQQYILVVLASEPMYGLAIKRDLEAYYGTEVNHGRLYPNLDDLVEQELVEKSELDRRTNQYSLTDRGYETVLGQFEWILEHYVTDEDRARQIRRLVDEQR